MQFAQHIQTDLISFNKQVKQATNVEATICLHLCNVSQRLSSGVMQSCTEGVFNKVAVWNC